MEVCIIQPECAPAGGDEELERSDSPSHFPCPCLTVGKRRGVSVQRSEAS